MIVKKMDEYIKKQAALDAIEKSAKPFVKTMANDAYWAYKAVEEVPAEDVVTVVRCKDCKHRIYDESRDFLYCEMYYGMGSVMDNNYCSFGERADK